MHLCLLVSSKLKVFASLDGALLLVLADRAFKTKDNLLCRLGFLVKNWFRLSSKSRLFSVITTLSLGKEGSLSCLVLSYFVKSMFATFLALKPSKSNLSVRGIPSTFPLQNVFLVFGIFTIFRKTSILKKRAILRVRVIYGERVKFTRVILESAGFSSIIHDHTTEYKEDTAQISSDKSITNFNTASLNNCKSSLVL